MSGSILADITSRDPQRVHSAMWDLIRLRDENQLDELAEALPAIERATADLELGGIIYSNARALDQALRHVRHHRDRSGCLCALYPGFLLYDPRQEAGAGNVRILGEHREHWRCECTACGATYNVQYGEAHAPWWEWTPAGD